MLLPLFTESKHIYLSAKREVDGFDTRGKLAGCDGSVKQSWSYFGFHVQLVQRFKNSI